MQHDERLGVEPAAPSRPTWAQRRSAGETTLMILAIFTVYVAAYWWSFGLDGGEWIRVGLAWSGALFALFSLCFVAAIGAVGGIALAASMVWQQRRSRRRITALLQDLDS